MAEPGTALSGVHAAPGRGLVRELAAAVALAAVLAGAGAALGWVWRELAPPVTLVSTPAGPVLADAYSEAPVAADAVFGAVGLAAGIGFGLLAYALRRWRGPVVLVGLALGSLAASWVCAKVGESLGQADYRELLGRAEAGQRLVTPVTLRADGMLFLQPITAVVTYVVAAAWSVSWPGRAEPGLSSGSSAPAARPVAPAPPSAGTAWSPPV